MKNLLLLLFVPFISFSQTFKDIMSINSVDMFKKVAIENGYEYDGVIEDVTVSYGFDISRDSVEGDKASKWMKYKLTDDSFGLKLARTNFFEIFDPKNPYDLIVKNIKQKCKYYKIINYNGTDYVTYSCSESSYKGKIGFVVSDGVGLIRHFPITK